MDATAQDLLSEAKRGARSADHMASVTYALFGDPKILLGAIENLHAAVGNAVYAALSDFRSRKRIEGSKEDFDSRFKAFVRHCAKPLATDAKHIEMIRDIRAIIEGHRKSPVEFTRRGRYVICDGDYSMKTLTIDQAKQYVAWTNEFIRNIEEGLSR